ncbi:MAG: acyl-CoA dehydrogenase family protein, partial [Myxococcota bacterium]|nr:acyl-CoA dehydrogenase family protein [Myxococcota bacterium]
MEESKPPQGREPAQERARSDLMAWREAQPGNFYLRNHQLKRLLKRWTAPEERAPHDAELTQFGATVAGPLDSAAILNNRPWNLPVLDRWSPIGERTEAIEHHPAFHECGEAIYQNGRVIAVYGQSQGNLNAQARFFLSSHAGEAGHNCPVACTAGVVKALQTLGTDEMKRRWLGGLLSDIYGDRLAGAQFLTELQGGSDVGANAVEARPDGEALGTTRWRIHGEKWFCSSADADLILMTARVQGSGTGTRGLGLFLVPRYLEDGTVNAYALRRLKDKLGTRSMVSAEIDFNGAVAYAMGPVEDGFRSTMNLVINTSRLYNSLGCAGLAQRATFVAHGYAVHRRAFGRAIIEYPLVQEMIAGMVATSSALLAGGL